MNTPEPTQRFIEVPRAGRRTRGQMEYQLYGAEDAWNTVVYHHGISTTAREASLLDSTAQELGTKIISINRPGYGESSSDPNFTVTGMADTVQRIADAERIHALTSMGMSAGTPYALVTAARVDRTTKAVVVNGMGPLESPADLEDIRDGNNREALREARFGSAIDRWILAAKMRLFTLLRTRPISNNVTYDRLFARTLQLSDREIVERPHVRDLLRRMEHEYYARGMYRDTLRLAQPWGFDLSEIEIPTHFVQGTDDQHINPALSYRMAAQIGPNAHVHMIPDRGHFMMAGVDREGDPVRKKVLDILRS